MKKKRVLVLALHVVFPLRNGADKYIACKWGALGGDYHVEMVGRDGLYTPDGKGGWSSICDERKGGGLSDSLRGVFSTALFVIGRQQFLSYKYKSGYTERLSSLKLSEQWDLIVVSFLGVHQLFASRLRGSDRPVVIETHNFDPKIYEDRSREATWPKSWLYRLAGTRSRSYIRTLGSNLNLCALGESDHSMYAGLVTSAVHTCGIGMSPSGLRTKFPKKDDPITLCFVGSLGIQMNEYAIVRFVLDEWSRIRAAINGARLYVIGSNPSQNLVQELLAHEGVSVHANLSDEDLVGRLGDCHASIIPFRDSNGLKLKVGLSLECGVPILSYLELDPALERAGFAFRSSSTDDWLKYLHSISSVEELRRLAEFASEYCKSNSWKKVALKTLESCHGEISH